MPAVLSHDRLQKLTVTHSPAEAADSRERHIQRLLARSRHLRPEDQRLLDYALRQQLSARAIAPLLARNHGSVVRRIRRLVARLCDPVIVALIEAGRPLAPVDRQIALAHHLRRQGVRRIAREMGIPVADVRRRLQYVRGWLTGRREGVRVARKLMNPIEIP